MTSCKLITLEHITEAACCEKDYCSVLEVQSVTGEMVVLCLGGVYSLKEQIYS